MSGFAYSQENRFVVRSRTDWGAIWAGVFTFIAIWAVFGMLGAAIFVRTVNNVAQNLTVASPITQNFTMRAGTGLNTWLLVLTVIAMYIAGRETGRLVAVTSRRDGLVHGMIMFGLSVVVAIFMTLVMGTNWASGSDTTASVHNIYLLDVFTALGWTGFFSVFLGWLAALWGASSGARYSLSQMKPTATTPSENAFRKVKPAA